MNETQFEKLQAMLYEVLQEQQLPSEPADVAQHIGAIRKNNGLVGIDFRSKPTQAQVEDAVADYVLHFAALVDNGAEADAAIITAVTNAAPVKLPTSPTEIYEMLTTRFPTRDEHQLRGFTYIKEQAIVRRLNQCFGAFGWQTDYKVTDGYITCSIGVFIDGAWLWRSNGSGAQAKEDAGNDKKSRDDIIKTAYTDAFKRAARTWGIGLYLLGE